jgi:hypothetical protein
MILYNNHQIGQNVAMKKPPTHLPEYLPKCARKLHKADEQDLQGED